MTTTSVRPVPAPVPATVRIARRHHLLVRITHWANVPLLLGLIASGLSIYWAAPVFLHDRDPVTHSRDYLVDLGVAIARQLRDIGGDPRHWIYDHVGLGAYQLAVALRLHWALAYLFMLNGALYAVGLARGGGWRAVVPRATDVRDAGLMLRFYAGVVPMALRRRPWPHPERRTRYNALQRGAYFTVIACGVLVTLSGWAMHKPVQFGWLERLFVNYDGARLVHFFCMLILAAFIVPHVLLVIADGWDTLRSMITGWSTRIRDSSHGRR